MMPMSTSFWMSAMLPESMNSFMSVLCFHGIGEFANALDLHGHRVPGRQRADALRRAGRNDVAGLERHHERDELNEEVDRKDQVPRVRRLTPIAVHPAFDAARVAVEPGRD